MATASVPAIAVERQIYTQKFRYYKDGRKGLRNREKEFMSIRINMGQGEAVYDTLLVCVGEDIQGGIPKLHPNGLQGESCEDGVFRAKRRANGGLIKIPHLQIERTKKKSELSTVLEPRLLFLPQEVQGHLRPSEGASTADFDTNKVRLLVLVASPDGSQWYNCCSEVISNERENSELKIIRLCHQSVSASRGGSIEVFTANDGPDITPDDFELYVKTDSWQSEVFVPRGDDINYKRVIHYEVPAYDDPNILQPVRASIVLRRRRTDQETSGEFTYEPNNEGVMQEKKRKTLSPEILRLSGLMPRKIPRRDPEQAGAQARPGVLPVQTMQSVQLSQPMQPVPRVKPEQVMPAPAVHLADLHPPVLPPAPVPTGMDLPASLSSVTYPAPPELFAPSQPLRPSRPTPPFSGAASPWQQGYPTTTQPVSAHPHLSHSSQVSIPAHSAEQSSPQHQASADEDLLAMAMDVIRHDPQYATPHQDLGGGPGSGVQAMEEQHVGGQEQGPVEFLESLSDLPPLPPGYDLDEFEARLNLGSDQK